MFTNYVSKELYYVIKVRHLEIHFIYKQKIKTYIVFNPRVYNRVN